MDPFVVQRHRAVGAGLLTVLTALTATAQPAPGGCNLMGEAQARLACYDRLFPPQYGIPPRVQPASKATAVPSPLAGDPASPAASAALPQAQAAAPAPDGAARFGLPAQQAWPAEVSEIASVIDGRFDGWKPGTRWRLLNGQTWEIVDGSSGAYSARNNPRVKIGRGLMGGFYLEVEGVSQSPKVKRLE